MFHQTSVDKEAKTQLNKVLLFECFSPKMILRFLVALRFFYSVIPWWRGQPAWFGSSVWTNQHVFEARALPPRWLASCSKCPKAKGIHLFLFAMSVQSYSKQKQQGSVLTADLSGGGGGGFSLLAAWCSPLTWSRPNHKPPADDMHKLIYQMS